MLKQEALKGDIKVLQTELAEFKAIGESKN